MAPVPGGRNAVEQIHTPGDPFEQIVRKTDTHKITGHPRRERRREPFEHPVHHRLRLSHREPADGDTGPGAARQGAFQGSHPQVVVGAALDDGPERLFRLFRLFCQLPVPGSAPFQPPQRPLHPFFRQLPRRLAGDDVVEHHGHVGAECPLDLHGRFGSDRAGRAIDVADELDPVLLDLPESLEGKHLEAARVGEHRAVPGGEAVEPAQRLYHRLAGPEMQMIGVAQDDLRAGPEYLVRMQPAHRPVGPHRHECRSLHRAVWQGEGSGAGEALGGVKGEFEHGLWAMGLWAKGYGL